MTTLRLERAVIVLRACSLVRQPIALALGELFGATPAAPRAFTLKQSGRTVFLRLRSSDLHVLHEVLYCGGYDLPWRAYQELARSPNAIDAGANIGLFTLFLCDLVPTVRVRAFEPDPENAAIARRNLAPFISSGRVELVEAAVGAVPSQVPFLSGMAMTSRRALSGEHGTCEVQQVDLLEGLGDVGLLKLDIEGGEWDILRDPRWKTRLPASLVMEWHAGHDGHVETQPRASLTELLSTADEVRHARSDSSVVGHLWAFRAHDRPALSNPLRG